MPREVFVTEDAARDLHGIFDYIADHDDPVKARNVLDRLEAAIETLAEFPERGAYPKELVGLGIREYREVHFKPYRIVYRVLGEEVYVYLVADLRSVLPCEQKERPRGRSALSSAVARQNRVKQGRVGFATASGLRFTPGWVQRPHPKMQRDRRRGLVFGQARKRDLRPLSIR